VVRIQPLPGQAETAISPAALHAITDSGLGSETPVTTAVELAGGGYNTTYRQELRDGTRAILRIAPAEEDQRPTERHLMRNEYLSIPFLKPVAALMPRILTADFTHAIVDRDYLIQTHLPGIPAAAALTGWPDEARAALWRSIGMILARVHTVRSDRFGRLMSPTANRWSECVITALTSIADECLALGVDGDDVRRVADLAARHDDVLDEVVSGTLLHGDLIPANVMVDPHEPGRGVIGLFDCDRTWWGDPYADWTFAAVDRLPSDQQGAFWTGYGTLPPSQPREQLRAHFYRARSLGEIRLEHARLGHQQQVRRTYELVAAVTSDLAAVS
jgi:aminoglycoside phosphotransferase (APT) family kinase protein